MTRKEHWICNMCNLHVTRIHFFYLYLKFACYEYFLVFWRREGRIFCFEQYLFRITLLATKLSSTEMETTLDPSAYRNGCLLCLVFDSGLDRSSSVLCLCSSSCACLCRCSFSAWALSSQRSCFCCSIWAHRSAWYAALSCLRLQEQTPMMISGYTAKNYEPK